MNRGALQSLSKDDLIALVLAQADVIAGQTKLIEQLSTQTALLKKQVADLEAKLGSPPKTPDNSSVPPSQARKPNREERRAARRKGRPGVSRALAENPDTVVEALAHACPHCAHRLGAPDQPAFHAYDHIDLPPIRPLVTRIHRHRGTCPCWHNFVGTFPGLKSGSRPAPTTPASYQMTSTRTLFMGASLAGSHRAPFG